MSDNAHYFDAARNFAADILKREPQRTPQRIGEVAKLAATMTSQLEPGFQVDVAALTAELSHLFSVEIDAATILEDHDPAAHVPWLPERRAGIQWRFWPRYITYLERDFGMAPTVVNAVDELTNMILERLEDPARSGPWDRRGMVVGSVQSGKTANYIGLICKAVDAGYKLVIILAGLHSNLRSQTQLRVDEGVLGFDTQKSRRLNSDNRWIGVGTHGEKLHIHSLTSSAEDGDFNKKVADNIGVMLGSDPVVLVVKKNSHLLQNLLTWVRSVAGTDVQGMKHKVVRDVPLLLIDDEADNASINTKARKNGGKGTVSDSDTASAINAKIRGLLATFEKSAYVGYTATPFANIFINPAAQSEALGEDIFPRSFIINVKPPSNYVGPAKVFGLDGDPDKDIPAEEGLDITRTIDDADTPVRFPAGHKKDHIPTELPPSLKKAVKYFVLVCAARRARKQIRVHNSMLVHVTRFVDVQEKVVSLILDELLPLQRRLQFGDGGRSPTIIDELRDLWDSEFVPVTACFPEEGYSSVAWSDIEPELHLAAAKIVVRPINGFAKEALDYKENEKDGLSVIAVGGDKLSRGLTLEGLSISYFLRTSQMYDTLMQMGRWFGYRKGYLDLCRLFTTSKLLKWYRHIALADVELRREFDYMVAANKTPKEYGLRVRTHPDGMIITAVNKMCHSQTLELSWAGVLVQTTQLPLDARRVNENRKRTEDLLSQLGTPKPKQQELIWVHVSAEKVAEYLEKLEYPPYSARASGKQLADFIREQAGGPQPELTDWTVVLVSSSKAASPKPLGEYQIGLINRTPERPPENNPSEDSFSLRKANLISPYDQSADLGQMPLTEALLQEMRSTKDIPELAGIRGDHTRTLRDLALDITHQRITEKKLKGDVKTDVPNGRVVRELRPKRNGLLLIYPLSLPIKVASPKTVSATAGDIPIEPVIGVALSFPSSDSANGVEYRVNRVWSQEMEDDAAYED